MTPRPCTRSSRVTFPRWTAVICWVASWPSNRDCARKSRSRSPSRRFADQVCEQRDELAALAPSLSLVREEPKASGADSAQNHVVLAERWQVLRQRLVTAGSLADMQTHIDAILSELVTLEQEEGN